MNTQAFFAATHSYQECYCAYAYQGHGEHACGQEQQET